MLTIGHVAHHHCAPPPAPPPHFHIQHIQGVHQHSLECVRHTPPPPLPGCHHPAAGLAPPPPTHCSITRLQIQLIIGIHTHTSRSSTSWAAGYAGINFNYILYSNYERQAVDLVDGRIDAAWNSPLAWVRAAGGGGPGGGR